MEDAKRISGKAESGAFALQLAALEWHPPQGLSAAVTKIRALLLASGFGVLLAHRIDGSAMQPQFFAAASRQLIQIKAGRPSLIPLQRGFLCVVAVIPNVVHRARLAIQQAIERFDTIAIDKQHRPIIGWSMDGVKYGTSQGPACGIRTARAYRVRAALSETYFRPGRIAVASSVLCRRVRGLRDNPRRIQRRGGSRAFARELPSKGRFIGTGQFLEGCFGPKASGIETGHHAQILEGRIVVSKLFCGVGWWRAHRGTTSLYRGPTSTERRQPFLPGLKAEVSGLGEF